LGIGRRRPQSAGDRVKSEKKKGKAVEERRDSKVEREFVCLIYST